MKKSFAVLTGHDPSFRFLFRIQHLLFKEYNKHTQMFVMETTADKQFEENVKYVPTYIPPYVTEEDIKIHGTAFQYMISKIYCNKIIPNTFKNIGWLDSDILTVSPNGVDNVLKENNVQALEMELHPMTIEWWKSILHWYNLDINQPMYNGGFVVAPSSHIFWERWQYHTEQLYLKNRNRLINFDKFFDYNGKDVYTKFYVYNLPAPLWMLDTISLGYAIKDCILDFKPMESKYNATVSSTNENDHPVLGLRRIAEDTQNIHLISVSKTGLLIDYNSIIS